jgi:DNA-binding NarL/FixJ family response regulator
MKTLLLVDDHPIFRDAIRTVVDRLDEPVHLEEFGALADVLTRLERGPVPAFVLLDLARPDCSGFEGLSALRSACPAVPVVVMSASESSDVIDGAAVVGASGFILKSSTIDVIRDALSATLRGEASWPSGMGIAGGRVPRLTPTQNRILVGLLQGRLNKQIAFEIGVTEGTIKSHLTEMFRKMGVKNRTQAVIAARGASPQ